MGGSAEAEALGEFVLLAAERRADVVELAGGEYHLQFELASTAPM